MKNLHLLQTEKPSRLYKNLLTDKLFILENSIMDVSECNREYQHIYITSDEEIKDGDWIYYTSAIGYCKTTVGSKGLEQEGIPAKKIILTTDPRLAPDVQKIDDEFLEWFVKNPSCEEVKIILNKTGNYREFDVSPDLLYKIIIPKEEPKQETQGYICPQTKEQCDDECCVSAEDCHIEASIGILSGNEQETVEEAAEKYSSISFKKQDLYDGFIAGASWQQEQILQFLYSEITERRPYSSSKMCEEVIKFIEKFKNK